MNYTIMAHYTPAAAMLLTLAAVWLNTVLIGMINFTLNLLVKKGIGAAVSVAVGLSPLLIVRLARFDLGYYFAPPLWMDLSNYRWQGYGYGPSFAYVYGVLLGCIGCLHHFVSGRHTKKRSQFYRGGVRKIWIASLK